MYFINTNGFDQKKPIQIWTQGENPSKIAHGFPTIDAPNQKNHTRKFISQFLISIKTLSNGTLENQSVKGNLRTDYWKIRSKNTHLI